MNNEDDLKEYEIYCEGALFNGGRCLAYLVGKETGATFEEACVKYAAKNPDFSRSFRVDKTGPKHWGCRLYDNEKDAKKSYG